MVAPFPSCGLRTAGFDKQHQHTLRCPRFLGTGLLLSKGARDAGHIVYKEKPASISNGNRLDGCHKVRLLSLFNDF